MKKLVGILVMGLMAMAPLNEEAVTGTIEGFEKFSDMSLVLFTLGADYPIEIGSVAKGGAFSIDLTVADLPEDMPEEDMGMFFGNLSQSFDGSFPKEDFGLLAEIMALKNRYISIMDKKNRWAGNVFPVTSEEIKEWMEDEAYNNAVPGSYLNIVFLEEPVTLQYPVTGQMPYEGEDIPVEYEFDLTLEPGFNWVQYDIEEVFETDIKKRGHFPTKITIRNLEDPSQFRWIGKFF